MATIDQLDLDSLIEDNSKLNAFLNHLKQNPNEIAKTVRAMLHQAHDKDYEMAEKDEEQEEGEEYLTQALDMCLMIAASTKEYDAYFKDLVEQNIIKTNVCGKLWQDNDEAYKCTTCELDSSCAICVDCFNAGNHTGHNCTFHYRNHLIHLVKRIKVAGGVCDCGDFQAWKPSGFCPKHRGISDEEDSLPPFFRDALRQIIIEILTYLNGVLSEIQDLDEDLKNDFSIRDAIMVTEWLEEFFKRGDSLRKLLAEEWIQIDNDGNSLLDIVMKHYPQLPEDVAEGIHNLFFPLLFVPTFRKRFLQRHFIPYYRDHIESHISRGANEKEILSDFPVQLFTVANCTNILKEEKMLEILGNKMYTIFSRAATDSTHSSTATVDPEDDMIFSHLYYRLTADCNYILAHKDMSHYFLYHSNSELVDMWSRVLRLIQCMNKKSNKRVLEGHAEFDSEIWIPAFLLDLELTSLLPLFLEGANFHNAKRNQSRFPQVVRVILKHLKEWLATESDLENFKVSDGANSYHLPLHRYLAGLISEGMKNWNFKLTELFKESQDFANMIMEHPLRIQVYISQIKVDMWNRNGREVTAQSETYNSVYFRDIFRDLDMFLLQICSILVGPYTFISRVLKKYELYEWMTSEGMKFDSESPNSKLLEEFLRLVVVIVTERTRAGATTEQLIRKEIIHRLAVEDHTHSQLVNTIESTLVDHVDFEKILVQVASFHEPKQMEQGTYSIKEECWDEFDRYFAHYSRAELEKAEERYSKARKSRMASFPLPVFPSLSPLSLPLYSHLFYKILFAVFYSATVDPTKVTETLMNEALQALHLSISLYNTADIVNAKDSEDLNNNNNNNKNKRKIIAFSGNILDLEFPTPFNVTQNSRHEVVVAGTEEKGESLISLLRKITKLQQFATFGDKVKNILRLFSEKDISCRQYIEILAGKEKHEGKEQSKEEVLEEEQEAKKRRKERQAAIMQKMKQDMAKFKVEATDEIEETETGESNPFPDISMNCPLCHEEHSLSSKPLGFVGLVQPTKILQIAKELQLRKKEEKELYLEEETPVGPRTPLRSPHPYGESDVEDEEFDYFGEEDEDEEDDQERLLADKDADRVTRAQAYMFSLMHDPIADQFQDEEDFDDDDDETDFALMSNEDLDNDDDDSDDDDHPDNDQNPENEEDLEVVEFNEEPSTTDQHTDQTFAEAIDQEEDMLDEDQEDHEIPEEDEEEQAVGNTSFMSHFLSDVMGNAMDNFEINEIEKAYAQVEKAIVELESNPFRHDADAQLEELEDQVEGLDDVLEELREDGVPPENLEIIEKKRKELREKMVGLIRNIKKPVFDLTRGMYLNVQYCNNHTIHAECLERYLLKLVERYNNSESYEGEDVIDLQRGEYLCVVCRRLANSLIPIIPYHTTFDKMSEISMKFQDWAKNLEILKSESFVKPATFNFTAPMTTVLEKYTQGLSEGKSGIIATETTDEEKDLFAAETLASSLGNSLAAIELSLRGKGPLLEITEKSHKINLRSQFLLCMAYRYHKMTSPALLYHQQLLYSIIKGATQNKSCPLMSLDLFSALLQLILIWPRPVTIKTDFVYLTQMLYQAALSQVVLEIYYGKVNVSDEEKASVKSGVEKGTKIECDIKFVKQLILPFLRCTALFAYTCLEMPLPEISDDVDDDFDESDYFEQFLHLPKLSLLLTELLSKDSMFHLWHQDIKQGPDMLPQLAPPEPFQLIQLPPLYHDLLQKYNKVRCVVCKTNPNTKAICLVCGMLVCAGNNCCRDARGIGEATKCGAGVGLFLILKMSSVLVIRDDRHSFWGSPYLDEHGEEDLHLIRGRPLYFNKERYEQLTQLYVNQRLEYDAKITETTTLGEAEWY